MISTTKEHLGQAESLARSLRKRMKHKPICNVSSSFANDIKPYMGQLMEFSPLCQGGVGGRDKAD